MVLQMGSRLLLAGNGLALIATISAFLQLLAWPNAGLLIITSITATSLLYVNLQKAHLSSLPGPTNAKAVHERPLETPTPHMRPRLAEPRPQSKQPMLREPAPRAPPPAPKPQPPVPKALPQAPKPQPIVPKAPPPVQTKPREKASETPTTIKDGDYTSYDLELDSGKELVGEVSASGLVNVYILTEENLTSLDLGQEFWHETGSEGVQKATLHFTPPEKGKWFLVVENADNKDVSASVKVRVNQTAQSEASGSSPPS